MGVDKLVTEVSMYTSCPLYGYLIAVYHGMDILTSNFMLRFILSAIGLTIDV
jgi:hypothetical protein